VLVALGDAVIPAATAAKNAIATTMDTHAVMRIRRRRRVAGPTNTGRCDGAGDQTGAGTGGGALGP
jgi:hypothetical protein